MKNYKYITILLLVVFILPSVALAAWWNPATWRVFSFLHRNSAPKEIPSVAAERNYEEKINELQKQIEDLKTKQTESSSVSDEVKSQIEKELKLKMEQNTLANREKTLSEKVGVSREKLAACIKGIDKTSLQTKISASVESAMKGLKPEERGTPYAVVVGSNGIKSEIRGAYPIAEIKKIIEEVKSGTVTTVYKGEVSVQEAGDHMLGSTNASVKIIEYSDLECPYCQMFHTTMKQVVAESNGSVSWVYRHWPIHSGSFEKLVAAECVAKEKGNDAFWKYIELIFGMMNTNTAPVTGQL